MTTLLDIPKPKIRTTPIPVPAALPGTIVKPEWIDHNGHMNLAYYLLAFDQASDVLTDYLGLTPEYKARTNSATFVGDIHIPYRQEVLEGDPLHFTAQVIQCDAKRVHFWLEMFHKTDGYLAATAEFISLHIDMSIRKVAPMPDDMLDWIRQVRDAHAALPLPKDLGRVIKVNP